MSTSYTSPCCIEENLDFCRVDVCQRIRRRPERIWTERPVRGCTSVTETFSGPDWYLGTFPGTGSVDIANPDQNLSLTEGRVDLDAYAGDAITQITFSNASNTNGAVGIVACNFGVKASSTVVGQGCIREFASFYEQMSTAAFDLTNTDLQAIDTRAGNHRHP